MLPRLLAVVAVFLATSVPIARAAEVQGTRPAPHDATIQAADEEVVRAAFNVLSAHGFAGLSGHIGDLRDVLGHAPAVFPAVELAGDKVVVRVNNDQQAMTEAQRLSLSRARAVSVQYNTYPLAAFLLAAYANERRLPGEAIPFADRGLALQPDNPLLVSEKAVALSGQGRWQEALNLVTGCLDRSDIALTGADRARLLRAKGFNLIELRRLTDARRAYQASLLLEPNHAGAENELRYIEHLEKGGPAAPSDITTGEKARIQGAPLPSRP